jgi:DNA helicase-2/ATP-dependent DNA helicase PcrA
LRLLARRPGGDDALPWAGTFHAIANRLLRLHAAEIGLDPAFTLLDREDAADLIDRLRHERGLARTDRRFPRKGTCLAIYSSVVNTQEPLRACLQTRFPWCLEWEEPLRALCAGYVDAKAARAVLDYDDLLLYWFHLMSDASAAGAHRPPLRPRAVRRIPGHQHAAGGDPAPVEARRRGVTVVGDDAQAIYSFRAARVGNILAFRRRTIRRRDRDARGELPVDGADPGRGQRGDRARARGERHEKNLTAVRAGGVRPVLATVGDELAQVTYVVERILERREAGVPLRQQACYFAPPPQRRAGGRARPPQHPVREVRRACVSSRQRTSRTRSPACAGRKTRATAWPASASRSCCPGWGRASRTRWCTTWRARASRCRPRCGASSRPPRARRLAGVRRAVRAPVDAAAPWAAHMGLVRRWYEPHVTRLYDDARVRLADLEQLEQLAAAAPSRERFLSELTLDPPAGPAPRRGRPTSTRTT